MALRAGVCNVSAGARHLDVEGDEAAIATALRRFADELAPLEYTDHRPRVTMKRGVGQVSSGEGLLTVGDSTYAPDAGDATAIVGAGDLGPTALSWAIDRLAVEDVPVEAAGTGGGSIVVIVPNRKGPAALRHVEAALASVPDA